MKRLWFFLYLMFLLSFAAAAQVNVLIVVHTVGGHTRVMAEAVARGARSIAGTTVTVRTTQESKPEEAVAADAIILGCPVHNANVTPAMQAYINSLPFEGAPLKDKVGAAFVCGGGISAGEELVQLNLLHSMMIFGMIVVGGPDWKSAFGASAVTDEAPFDTGKKAEVQEAFLKKAEALGARVASVAARLKGR